MALVQKFSEDQCPMLNGLDGDVTSAGITRDFTFKNRKMLHATCRAQLFLSPHLSLEDPRNQQTIIKNFKSFWNGHISTLASLLKNTSFKFFQQELLKKPLNRFFWNICALHQCYSNKMDHNLQYAPFFFFPQAKSICEEKPT